MKLFIKKILNLLSLILIIAITGCTTLEKRNTNKPIQTAQTMVDPSSLAEKNRIALSSTQQQFYSTAQDIQTGRYSTISSKPTHAQRKLLQVMITVSIPDEITGIGQTLRYLLKRSGYQLVQPSAQQIELTEFLYKRLPEVHRHIGPMTLHDALTILTAPAFSLKEDPVHRLISYELNKYYAGEIQ